MKAIERILRSATLTANINEQIYKPNNAFIRPLKQNMIKDNSLSPMARLMLALLRGWDGSETGIIETNVSVIAKHLGRTTRHVHRLLSEARAAGYIWTSRTCSRIGYITGLKIRLVSGAIAPNYKPVSRRNGGMTKSADTNRNIYKPREKTQTELDFIDQTNEILKRNGCAPVPI